MDSVTAKILRDGSAALGRALIGRGGKKADVEVLLDNLFKAQKKAEPSSQEAQALLAVAESLECAVKTGSVTAFQASKAFAAADAALVAIGEPVVTI